MSNCDHDHTEDQQNFINQLSKEIQSSLHTLLNKYSLISTESSSEEAFIEINTLNTQVSELHSKIEELCSNEINPSSLDRDQGKLRNLQQELKNTVQVLRTLKEKVNSLKQLSEDLLLDPQEGETLEIVDVDVKLKDGDREVWSVSVKSDKKNKGNFRNVRIVENGTGKVVARFLLIEPGTKVKLRTEEPLVIGSSLFAQVDERVVSGFFYVYPLKIAEVVMNDSTEVIVKNLTRNDYPNFGIYGEGVNWPTIYSIGAYGSLKLRNDFALVTDKIVLYRDDNGHALSCYYFLQNNSEDELLDDLSEDQKNLFYQYHKKHPDENIIQLKLSIIKGEIRF